LGIYSVALNSYYRLRKDTVENYNKTTKRKSLPDDAAIVKSFKEAFDEDMVSLITLYCLENAIYWQYPLTNNNYLNRFLLHTHQTLTITVHKFVPLTYILFHSYFIT